MRGFVSGGLRWSTAVAVLLAAIVSLWTVVGAGSAFASHISCGQVLTQDTTLDSDLVDCPANGLVIGAPNISVDLNGYMVDGPGRSGGPGVGIYDPGGFDGITVENGTVREFEYGLLLDGMTGSSLDRLSVVSNLQDGILMTGSQSNRITRSNIDANTEGVRLGPDLDGIGSDGNLVTENRMQGNGAAGVITAQSDANVIEGNTLSDDARGNQAAIMVISSSATQVVRNDVSDNPNFGIILSRTANSYVARNSADRNGSGIVITENSSGNTVERNSASENRQQGIWIASSPNNTVEWNTAQRNRGNGFFLSGNGNRFADNTATENSLDGFFMASATGNVLVQNTADRNGDDGIDILSAGNTIGSTRAYFNADLGIAAVTGTIDAGHNRAKHNGNPLQCVNVAC
jgi:parallel beta-helix repeat protein